MSFRAHVCPCMRNTTSESCVDLIYLQCQEYMSSIRNALKYRPSVKNRIEICKCAMHTAAREHRAIMELILDVPANDETTIQTEGGQTSDMISATCCKAVAHSTIACQEIRNGKAPILIPWKCTHTSACADCGIRKNCKSLTAPFFQGLPDLYL
jgi:hypothetical protein